MTKSESKKRSAIEDKYAQALQALQDMELQERAALIEVRNAAVSPSCTCTQKRNVHHDHSDGEAACLGKGIHLRAEKTSLYLFYAKKPQPVAGKKGPLFLLVRSHPCNPVIKMANPGIKCLLKGHNEVGTQFSLFCYAFLSIKILTWGVTSKGKGCRWMGGHKMGRG